MPQPNAQRYRPARLGPISARLMRLGVPVGRADRNAGGSRTDRASPSADHSPSFPARASRKSRRRAQRRPHPSHFLPPDFRPRAPVSSPPADAAPSHARGPPCVHGTHCEIRPGDAVRTAACGHMMHERCTEGGCRRRDSYSIGVDAEAIAAGRVAGAHARVAAREQALLGAVRGRLAASGSAAETSALHEVRQSLVALLDERAVAAAGWDAALGQLESVLQGIDEAVARGRVRGGGMEEGRGRRIRVEGDAAGVQGGAVDRDEVDEVLAELIDCDDVRERQTLGPLGFVDVLEVGSVEENEVEEFLALQMDLLREGGDDGTMTASELDVPGSVSALSAAEGDGLEEREKEICVIDREVFQKGERVLRLPCFHVFHEECMMPYLEREEEPVCPIDRAPVPKGDVPLLPVWRWGLLD